MGKGIKEKSKYKRRDSNILIIDKLKFKAKVIKQKSHFLLGFCKDLTTTSPKTTYKLYENT